MAPIETRNWPSRSYPWKLLSALVIASMATAVALSASSIANKHGQPGVVLTGMVSDTMCGKTHIGNTVSDAECTRECVELGAGYALVAAKKMYVLQGHQEELYKFAGQTVVVTGIVLGRDTVVVTSVTPQVVDVMRRIPASEDSRTAAGGSTLSASRQ